MVEDNDSGDADEVLPKGVTSLVDAKSQRDRKQRAKGVAEERAAVLAALLSTPAGRRWYAWLLHEVCGLYRPVANAAFDAQGLHYREGARAVGQILHENALRDVKNQYIVLLAENLNQG